MSPPLIGGGIKGCFCLMSDVYLTLSVWHQSVVSVAYIRPNSRTVWPRKTKIGTEVAHVTRDSDTTFKVKVTRSLWLVVLAGQHGHTVCDLSICAHDVHCVTTCRPGRGHIVAAAHLQLVLNCFWTFPKFLLVNLHYPWCKPNISVVCENFYVRLAVWIGELCTVWVCVSECYSIVST